MKLRRGIRPLWCSQSGATAVEFALVCLPLLLLMLGIIEFGRAFYVRNDLSYAADFAARKVLIGQIARDAPDGEAQQKLARAVRESFHGGDPALLQIVTGKETVDGIDFRILSIQYPFTFVLPGLAGSPFNLQLSRRIPIG
ncbi:TadE/TadG family type IV pilus assembly protein [Sinorhizobium mexicanum]|uniref:Pilus assembly protein n=1 Tax=Sinorhizobium mexicanum TaxID=375549 RepID=A0A859R4Q2_9HYPH|nr:TadE/TadG family type IV pilus assembly protein [Sinorhizobium mexicanum]MBP1886651.1 Flp pilus assembly protein TadG [Sinorhizobium mexicanum]QLL65871.1 pilus assembly protein [Sinorhizobium mexicanum]